MEAARPDQAVYHLLRRQAAFDLKRSSPRKAPAAASTEPGWNASGGEQPSAVSGASVDFRGHIRVRRAVGLFFEKRWRCRTCGDLRRVDSLPVGGGPGHAQEALPRRECARANGTPAAASRHPTAGMGPSARNAHGRAEGQRSPRPASSRKSGNGPGASGRASFVTTGDAQGTTAQDHLPRNRCRWEAAATATRFPSHRPRWGHGRAGAPGGRRGGPPK